MTAPPVHPVLDYRPSGATVPPRLSLVRTGRRWLGADAILGTLTRASSVLILLLLVALMGVLINAAIPSMRTFGWAFLTSSEWRPNPLEQPQRGPDGKILYDRDGEMLVQTIPPAFGALPVIFGTSVSSLLALLVAVPLSLGTAIFLVRIAPHWASGPISFLVEFLAAIPSIAYGIWGLFVLAPFLQNHLEPAMSMVLRTIPGFSGLLHQHVGPQGVIRILPLTGRDMLCGGLILGIMILPIITAISRDVLKAVPPAQIEGSLALGATWWQSSREMLRYTRSALFGAVMLGLARAAGETMAITMVIGNNNQIASSPFAPAQTMSSLLANEFAEASSPLHRSALIEVALILLVMSLVVNVIARYLVVGVEARTAAAH